MMIIDSMAMRDAWKYPKLPGWPANDRDNMKKFRLFIVTKTSTSRHDFNYGFDTFNEADDFLNDTFDVTKFPKNSLKPVRAEIVETNGEDDPIVRMKYSYSNGKWVQTG